MRYMLRIRPIQKRLGFASQRTILPALLLAATPLWPAAPEMQSDRHEDFFQKIRPSVVAVRVQKQLVGASAGDGLRQVFMNGVLVDTRVRPNLIKTLQSNGVAYDRQGHVVCYVGYKWLALNPKDPGVKIELMRPDGQTTGAKLVGIDQRSGIAVIQASAEVQLLPRTILRASDASRHAEYYLVDMESRDPVRKVSLRHSSSGRDSSYFINEGQDHRQGQLVFSPDAQLLGFVSGRDADAGANSLTEVQLAQNLLGSVTKVIDTGSDVLAGWLGVFIDERAAGSGYSHVVVTGVIPESPADKSQVQPGDVLLQFNDAPIRNAPQFLREVSWAEVGSRARLLVRRGKESLAVPVQIGARREMPEASSSTLYLQFSPGAADSGLPEIELREIQALEKGISQAIAAAPRPRLGIVCDDLTPQLGNFFGVDGGRGVLIISVTPGSLAERHGMKAGDVIVALNGDPVINQLDFFRILTLHSRDTSWSFRMMRERKSLDLKVVPQAEPPKK